MQVRKPWTSAVFTLCAALVVAAGGAGCRRPYASGQEMTLATCLNGIDDDGDGLIDCLDPGCVVVCGGTDGGAGSDGGSTFCGDGLCNGGESCMSCEQDCGMCPAGCGDGTCAPTETCASCDLDCGTCPAVCGDGICDPVEEDCTSCSADCGTCPAGCPDGSCTGGETCTTCPADCGSCCGNGVCAGGETCTTCVSDCGACCGNGTCSGGETCSSCPSDCGPCGPVCGNAVCEVGETCSSCASDCSIFGTSIGSDTYYEGCKVTTGASSVCPDVAGTTVAMGDDVTGAVTIPFSFPFYGGSYTSVTVSSNGRLEFGGAPDTGFTNACLSSTSAANNIFVLWDDLDASLGGITYLTMGTAPNRTLAIEWQVPAYTAPSSDPIEVRVYLFEGTGEIAVCYVDTTSGTVEVSGGGATTGIHGTSFDYIQNTCNGTVTAGTVVYYLPL